MIDTSVDLELLNQAGKNTLAEVLKISFIEIHENYIKSRMPVVPQTMQSFGILHGGASAALAEHTASAGAFLSIDRNKFACLGLELKINHIKSVEKGFVYATATPVHVGIQTQLWKISITDDDDNTVAFSTLTLLNVPLDKNMREKLDLLLQHSS